MDTETVLKIIAMLDAKIFDVTSDYCDLELFMISHDEPAFLIKQAKERYQVRKKALVDFSNHLQKHIDSLQNQVENDMNRGD